MKITHYDLFAGIGGFSLALDTIFHEEEIKHIFCEWEAFPTAVLKKHWPDGTYYSDIADLVADTRQQLRKQGDSKNMEKNSTKRTACPINNKRCSDTYELTILTGGFPCQPFSQAGRRQGTSDDRYKWPEMFAVIRNVRPDWVIAENVRGLASWNEGMVLETVCTDLEAEGYEVRPYIIPACGVGAPHKRERVWIVAHSNGIKSTGEKSGSPTEKSAETIRYRESDSASRQFDGTDRQLSKDRQFDGHDGTTNSDWREDWREVAFATCHDGVDDGLPRRLDGATLRGKRTDTISASKHRQERLKACGNAIVPQVAMEIFKAIKVTMI